MTNLVIGIFVGGFFGFALAAICAAAGKSDRQAERECSELERIARI